MNIFYDLMNMTEQQKILFDRYSNLVIALMRITKECGCSDKCECKKVATEALRIDQELSLKANGLP